MLYICLEKKYNKVQKYIPDSIKTKYKKSIGRQYVEFCLIACEFCGTSIKRVEYDESAGGRICSECYNEFASTDTDTQKRVKAHFGISMKDLKQVPHSVTYHRSYYWGSYTKYHYKYCDVTTFLINRFGNLKMAMYGSLGEKKRRRDFHEGLGLKDLSLLKDYNLNYPSDLEFSTNPTKRLINLYSDKIKKFKLSRSKRLKKKEKTMILANPESFENFLSNPNITFDEFLQTLNHITE